MKKTVLGKINPVTGEVCYWKEYCETNTTINIDEATDVSKCTESSLKDATELFGWKLQNIEQ